MAIASSDPQERACGMCTQFKTTSTSAEDGNSLLDHIRLNHSFYVFVKKCDNCPSVFRDQNALADHHAAVHQGPRDSVCRET